MNDGLTRRRFIQNVSLAAGAAYMMPAASWARVPGANDRLVFGMVGQGGQGSWHRQSLVGRKKDENVEIKKVCDVYRRRLNRAIKDIGGDSTSGTMDYREVLDDKDLNCVLIATPDHWHTKIAIEAMDAGKDVYCEKPLSLTVEQAIACRDAVHRTKRVLQVGPQGTSEPATWAAREAIGKGRIGKVVWSQAAYCRNSQEGQFNWPIDGDAGPQNDTKAEGYVDWEQWLGTKWNLAPKIPWSADRFFRFRKYWDYNGGVATDLMYHKLAPLLIAISGPNGEYPKRVTAAGGQYIEKDGRDIADQFFLMIDYPSEHTIVIASVMTNDDTPPTVIRGQYGTMNFGAGAAKESPGSKVEIVEQGTWWKKFREANADQVKTEMVKNDKGDGQHPEPREGHAKAVVEGPAKRDHVGNFLDAIRKGDALDCNIDLGASTMVAIKMGVEAYRNNKVLTWDAKTEKVVGT
jgi:predicted dehydrogenase